MLFKGAATAVITPFKKDGVDFDNFEKQLDHQLKSGIKAIIVCGTTGEATTMSDSERFDAVSFVVKKVKKRIPVIAGTGSNDTMQAVKLSSDAYKAGADAILVTAPYYNKTSKKGMVTHFHTIADSVPIPLLMYNVPGRTGINIDVQQMIEISKNKRVIGVKECNLAQMPDVIQKAPDHFTVYSGDDGINLQALALGAMGVISVLSNVMPKEVSLLNDLFLNNEIEKSRDLFYKLQDIVKLLFIETNPIPIKRAMRYIGLDSGILRLPLVEMDETAALKLKKEMEKLGLIK